MEKIQSSYRIYYTHFDREELQDIFSLEMLREMYKFYSDLDVCIEDVPKDPRVLAAFLHLRVKKQIQSHSLIKKGDLVKNFKGILLRIKEVNYFDARLGNLPLVYNIDDQSSYAHVGYLMRTEEIEFADNVSIVKRIKLANMLKSCNFVQVNNKLYKVGELYVINNKTADTLLHAKKWWKPHKLNR